MRHEIGRYNGVDYRLQRISDVLCLDDPKYSRQRWYFSYFDGEASGDHFRTLTEFHEAVDAGHFQEVVTL